MFIKDLNLIAFRNYLEAQVHFDNFKTIIIGNNAQGKSNLLEVIQILTQGKSRRVKKDSQLINFDLQDSIIRAEICANDQVYKIALQLRQSGRRSLKINDKQAKKSKNFFASVSFMVDDLEIINGRPGDRRDWLDILITQLEDSYAQALDEFENSLAQRNSFLKNFQDKNIFHVNQLTENQKREFEIWDGIFLDKANHISRSREGFAAMISPVVEKYYQKISQEDKKIQIEYQGKELNSEDLNDSRAKDLARGCTSVGPQRDDLIFLIEGKNASFFASQGEKRSIALSLKLTELELLKNKLQESPILLLDDVLAELDENRQDYLLESIEKDTQVIITTTHLGKHLSKWSQDAEVLEIRSGRVFKFAEQKL